MDTPPRRSAVDRRRSSLVVKVLFLGMLVVFCGGLFGVYLLGALEPAEHHARVRAELPVPADSVWKMLADLRGRPAWRPEITLVQVMSRDSSGIVYREFLDDREGMRFRVEQQQPGRLWKVRNITPDFPLETLWTWELESTSRGCRVTLSEEGRIGSTTLRFYFSRVAGYDSQIRLRLEQLIAGLGLQAEVVELLP